jgi:hypothetical protein
VNIKAIIFDFFGVFCEDPLVSIGKEIGIKSSKYKQLDALDDQLSLGMIDVQKYIELSAKILNWSEKEVYEYFLRSTKFNNELLTEFCVGWRLCNFIFTVNGI